MNLEVNTLLDWKPMQFHKEWSYMIVLVGLIHNSGSTVQNPLKPLK